jgi:hypothetical protein
VMSVISFDWSFLKRYMQRGEAFIEGNEEHLAVLLARHLDAERRAQLETDVAAIDATVSVVERPADPVADAPPAVAGSGDGAAGAAPVDAVGTDANGSPVA